MHMKTNKIQIQLPIINSIAMMNSDARSIQSQFQNMLQKASQPSVILTASSKRFNYAIQSIPHQIKQTKTAFRDYFNYDDNDEISQQQISNRPSVSNIRSSMKLPTNPYANQKGKKMLPIKLKNIVNQRLFQCFKTINEKRPISTTARKLPTFRATSSEIKINPQQTPIQIRQSFVGSISKQFVQLEQSTIMKKKTSSVDEASLILADKSNVCIVNKLLLLEGTNLLQSYGNRINKMQQKDLDMSRKIFLILNQH